MSDETVTGTERLYDRLLSLNMLEKCVSIGCQQAGLPLTYREDASQECMIIFYNKMIDSSLGHGQCVNLAKTIANRTAQQVRRQLTQATVIPQDIFQNHDPGARQQVIDVTEDLTSKTMASEGHMNLDEHDADQSDSVDLIEAILARLDDADRERIDRALKKLPRSQIKIVYRVVFLGDTVEYACQQMGINPESGERYVQRIHNVLKETE